MVASVRALSGSTAPRVSLIYVESRGILDRRIVPPHNLQQVPTEVQASMTLPFRPRPPAGAAATEFDQLFLANYGRLCQFAYGLVRSRQLAEDIVQDLFLSLWCRRAEVNLDDPLAYLFASVRNRAISHSRRERWRLTALATHAVEAVAEWTRREPSGQEGDLAAAIAREVAALPERRRLIFTMHREQHLSYLEIARALDISVKTVETQMGRALKTLRTRLAPYLTLVLLVASFSLMG